MSDQDAYWRTLRDIESGHIGVYATVYLFDPQTGQRYDQPHVHSVRPDRAGPWWDRMIAAGHLELRQSHDRWFYLVTAAGLAWLAAHAPLGYACPR